MSLFLSIKIPKKYFCQTLQLLVSFKHMTWTEIPLSGVKPLWDEKWGRLSDFLFSGCLHPSSPPYRTPLIKKNCATYEINILGFLKVS